MPKIKVCGLTSVDDALACAAAGVDWVGLNFHPPSPRSIEPDTATRIAAALPVTCEPVGLFVNRPVHEVADVARRVGLRIVQLHGDEPPETIAELGHLRVIRAFRIADARAVDAMIAYLDRTKTLGRLPDAVLLDAYAPGLAGGTGRTIDAGLLDILPNLRVPPVILAGGLTPENVAERVARVRPWMVDTASGVESAPGRKDPARIKAFVRAARISPEAHP